MKARMAWALGAWLLLSVAVATVFALLRRRYRPVTVPSDVRDFLRVLEPALREHSPRVELLGMVPGRFAAVVVVNGQETPVSLHHLFRRWLAFPDCFRETLSRFLDELEQAGLGVPTDHSFADAAPHVLPQVRSREWFEQHSSRFGSAALVHRPLAPDLVICYVIDEPWCMTFVCQAHLRHWGRSEEDVFHLATRNLHQLAGAEVPIPEDKDQPLLLRTGDGFDATRVLLLDPERVEGLLIAIPERDVLWLGSEGVQDLGQLMSTNREQSERSTHPVSPHLYRMQDGHLVPVD